jgi:hypothetical protein
MKKYNPKAAGKTMTPETALVKADCDRHPGVQAVIRLHNLLRDEYFTVCTPCLVDWVITTVERVRMGLGAWSLPEAQNGGPTT